MINPRAEESFQSGKRQLRARRYREAVAFFKAAIDIESETVGSAKRQGRYVSYYGLALCRSRSGFHDALRHCRSATKLDPERPNVWWNLARVAFALGRRGEAYRACRRGLKLEPDHAGLLAEVKRIGVRRTPLLPFLPRQHGLNVALGRMRARLTAGKSQATRKGPASAPLAARADGDEASVMAVQVVS